MVKELSSAQNEINKLSQETTDLLRDNSLKFIIGTFCLLAFFIVLLIYAFPLYSNQINHVKNGFSNIVDQIELSINSVPEYKFTDEATNSVTDTNYLSNENAGQLDINGEISAVSTSRVQYSKNTYVVAPGDTLFLIAEKVYGDRNDWLRLANENKIANYDRIEVGQTLKIPR